MWLASFIGPPYSYVVLKNLIIKPLNKNNNDHFGLFLFSTCNADAELYIWIGLVILK